MQRRCVIFKTRGLFGRRRPAKELEITPRETEGSWKSRGESRRRETKRSLNDRVSSPDSWISGVRNARLCTPIDQYVAVRCVLAG